MSVCVYTGKGESQSLTCLHLSPKPAARSPKPPSGGWRTRTAVPEGRRNGWQVDRLPTHWTSQEGRGGGAGMTLAQVNRGRLGSGWVMQTPPTDKPGESESGGGEVRAAGVS